MRQNVSQTKKFIVSQGLKTVLGNFASIVDIANHKMMASRPLEPHEKDRIRKEGLSFIRFETKRKRVSLSSKKHAFIYCMSNGFRRSTLMTIGKPTRDIVLTQMDTFARDKTNGKVYYAVLRDMAVIDAILDDLRIRTLDGIVFYAGDLVADDIERLDTRSMESSSFWKNIATVAGTVSLTTLGMFVLGEVAGHYWGIYGSPLLQSIL